MNLFFRIYLLGSAISLFIALTTLVLNKKKAEKMLDEVNERMSEKLNYYEKVSLINGNFYCAINFLLSWIQVVAFIFNIIPSRAFMLVTFYRLTSNFFVWIHLKSFIIAEKLANKHNNIISEYNKKHGIKNE